ncbi:MCE family protein [Actinomadura fulvescens]|uniref:MCE family protein n=1 Tax=Actinomadura fulvescens TaxID=46160 RepID=A0ABN3Q0J0_9ACTN
MTEESLSSRSMLVYALIGVAALLLAAVVITGGAAPSDGPVVRYGATFRTAGQGLDPERSDVKVRGVVVGKVESVRLAPDGRVSVTMRVDRGIEVSTAASAAIEPVSVFGPKDLTLEPGDGPRLPDGGTIRKTTDPRELADAARPAYDLVRAINPDDVATLLHALGHGLSGQGPVLRRTVDHSAVLIDLAHANRATIQGLITDVAAVATALGGQGEAIAGTARDFNQLAPAIHARPDRVGRLLDATAGLSDRVAGILQRQGGHLGGLIDGAGRAARIMAKNEKNIVDLLEVLDGFFNGLQGVVRVPGPEGSLLAQGMAYMSINPCDIFIDICPRPLR